LASSNSTSAIVFLDKFGDWANGCVLATAAAPTTEDFMNLRREDWVMSAPLIVNQFITDR
jgi:hypothetical protein